MGKGVHKLTGFLWALIIAIVSFFVIFLFFPEVSYRFFGTSLRKSDLEKAKEAVAQTASDMADKAADLGKELVVDAASAVVK